MITRLTNDSAPVRLELCAQNVYVDADLAPHGQRLFAIVVTRTQCLAIGTMVSESFQSGFGHRVHGEGCGKGKRTCTECQRLWGP